jgi:hypothetical protein
VEQEIIIDQDHIAVQAVEVVWEAEEGGRELISFSSVCINGNKYLRRMYQGSKTIAVVAI